MGFVFSFPQELGIGYQMLAKCMPQVTDPNCVTTVGS